MEITYELISLYGATEQSIKDATIKLSILFEESYVEEQEVMDIASSNDVVILYETTETTGYSEVFLIDNRGELEDMVTFSLDEVDLKRQEIKNTSLEDVFDPVMIKQIHAHMNEHNITEQEFLSEYLDELLLDHYETEKARLNKSIKEYYKR